MTRQDEFIRKYPLIQLVQVVELTVQDWQFIAQGIQLELIPIDPTGQLLTQLNENKKGYELEELQEVQTSSERQFLHGNTQTEHLKVLLFG